jgi:hypothetical protein
MRRRRPGHHCRQGHEKYQVIGGRTIPFDDVAIAQAALADRRRGSRV